MLLTAEENPVAIVTGASRGVGLATAETFAEKGYTVYGTVRSSPPASNRPNLHFISVDLLIESSIHSAIQTVLDQEGRIDVLINNAGYALVGPVESLTQQEMREQMEVNFYAPVEFIQAVLPTMREQRSGHIINITSTNAVATCPFGSMYSASKSALESLSESLAVEVKPFYISVSIVEPGYLTTNFSAKIGTKEIPNNPYQPTLDTIQSSLKDRLAYVKSLPSSQTPEEIAEFLFNIVQDPHPKLRYQTSEEATKDVSTKLLDLTGERFLQSLKN